MTVAAARLYEICDRTWPAARRFEHGNWTLREGRGGGKRVSAATARGPVESADIDEAEIAMRALDQTPLFMVREGDEALDRLLDARGYGIVDPVIMYTIPTDRLTDLPIPRVTAFEIWEPLAIMREIWAQGGVGTARIAVMERAEVKTAILSRWKEKPGGVAFAAVHDGICMVHAVEVLPHQRRQGVAGWMMRRAAFWAQARGAALLAVLCVEQNAGANALYQAIGFTECGRYHYRQSPR
ncbi:Acetyltransferase (GNAT) family protein [Sulfitobacter sp. THAF37]|uniref:GNAT family N-acetyltransferase n=1 Tax=Sulfitobacter sp. THAF37 TaxID=2587855 RepID=UPI001268886C|nr:GNAT family N-acetyltransferase [Sulfitobacter sp. THAF37]QFT57956.1 Acetyltransferase (GNAT) family protein [Sulfitobacter sp. THAF37]